MFHLHAFHCFSEQSEEKGGSPAPVFDLKAGKRSSEIDQIINEMNQGFTVKEEDHTDVNDDLLALITDE